ncbi:MAG: hypothetical protein AABW50_01635 [Nanoarchaeota archaeon]
MINLEELTKLVIDNIGINKKSGSLSIVEIKNRFYIEINKMAASQKLINDQRKDLFYSICEKLKETPSGDHLVDRIQKDDRYRGLVN